MNYGSIFTGIGGFDLGFDRAGMACSWQVEHDKQCIKLLKQKWPSVWRWTDIKSFLAVAGNLPAAFKIDLLCGGDPCPKHGNARRGKRSAHPDLSGYFLALAGRLRPRWVVRENVPAPTVSYFATGLESLGYGTTAVAFNARDFTLQNRLRTFVIGCSFADWKIMRDLFQVAKNASLVSRATCTRIGEQQTAKALTTRFCNGNTDQNYVFEPSGKLRVLDNRERARLAGFPEDWACGFSQTAQARMYGNSVCPPIARKIGEAILRFENEHIQATS